MSNSGHIDDGTAAEQFDGEDVMSGNSKGNDWVATIVGGIIVGVIVAGASRLADQKDDTRDRVVALGETMDTVKDDVKSIKSAGYVGRSEFEREISRVDRRLDAVEAIRGK